MLPPDFSLNRRGSWPSNHRAGSLFAEWCRCHEETSRLDCLCGSAHAGRVTAQNAGALLRARRRASAPGRCASDCWRRRSSAWSSSAGPAPPRRSSASVPASPRRPAAPLPGTRALVAAAVEHLTERRRTKERAASELPARGRTRAVVGLLAADFTASLFSAALELWVAARTDPALRVVGRAAGTARRSRDSCVRAGAARRRRARRRQPGARAGHARPAARLRPRRLAQRRQPSAATPCSTPGPPCSTTQSGDSTS